MKFTRKVFRKFLSVTVLPFLKYHLRKPRRYRSNGINLIINHGVFHPGFFFSTQYLLGYLKGINLESKKVLELGAGSGLLAFYANQKDAIVSASDISATVIKNLKENLVRNSKNFEIIHSDLFDNFGTEVFDIVLINPPYYKREPRTEADLAWFCGKNSEYFTKLFHQLPKYINKNSVVLMVLSEDCAFDEIAHFAIQNNLSFSIISKRRIWLEMNFLIEIRLNQAQ